MPITQEEFQKIRQFVEQHSGILIGDNKEYLVENRLMPLLVQHNCDDFFEFHKKLQNDPGPLRNKVIDMITTNETLWFRDNSFYDAFFTTVIPKLIKKAQQRPSSKIRIWSAACSTGQEPYSIAMLLHNALERMECSPTLLDRFEILATDISPSALVIAKRARYSQLAISRGMRSFFLDHYFKKTGIIYELDESIRKRVRLQLFNLQNSFSHFGMFDLVLLRNVLIYFSESMKRDIYKKTHAALAHDGLLAIGTSESLRGYSTAFEQILIGNSVLYKPR